MSLPYQMLSFILATVSYVTAKKSEYINENLNSINLVNISTIKDLIFDFIVVGGGGSGCVYARTIADKGFKVLLIERGKSRKENEQTIDMDGAGRVINNLNVSQPIVTPSGLRTHVPNVLGGGTSIGMGIIIQEDEYFFEKMKNENNYIIDRNLYRESHKWILERLGSENTKSNKITDQLKNYFLTSDYPSYYNSNDSLQENGMWTPYSLFDQKNDNFRKSADYVLGSIKFPQPKKLYILTEYTVDYIDIEKSEDKLKATCVYIHKTTEEDTKKIEFNTNMFNNFIDDHINNYQYHSKLHVSNDKSHIYPNELIHKICATKEIALAAGSIFTPVILAKSGIGNKRQLEELGITNPYVINENLGRNLVDRLLVPLALFMEDNLPDKSLYDPEVCGLVGFNNLNKSKFPLSMFPSAMNSFNLLRNKNTNFSRENISFEQMKGANILEGFLFATRIFLPPRLRDSVIVDSFIDWTLKCIEDMNYHETCKNLAPLVNCLGRIYATWTFLNDPKSNGSVFLTKFNKLQVDPNYLSSPEDRKSLILATRKLLQFKKNFANSDKYFENYSDNSCPVAAKNIIAQFIKQLYEEPENEENSDKMQDIQKSTNKNPFNRKNAKKIYEVDEENLNMISSWPPKLPNLDKDEEILDYIFSTAQSIWHTCCTVSRDKVLNENFAFKEIPNLSVVDASWMSFLTRMNPTATILTMSRYIALLRSKLY